MGVNERENVYGKMYTIVIFVISAVNIKLHYSFNTDIFLILS